MAKKKYFGSKSFAGMPMKSVMKPYPKNGYALTDGGYPDTIAQTDARAKSNLSKVRKSMKKMS